MTESTQSLQSLHEALSAAIDGEAEELELRRVVNAVRSDPELGAKWQRLHLAQGLMRGRGDAFAAPNGWRRPWMEANAATTSSDADAESPTASEATNGDRWAARRWLKPLTGVAVAAAAAFVVVAYFGDRGVAEPTTPAAALAQADTTPPRSLAQVPTETDLRRANVYMLQHARHSTLATRPAVMPFAKVLAVREPSDERGGETWPAVANVAANRSAEAAR